MGLGDFIENLRIAFGGKPSAVVRCEKRIMEADTRIKSIQESYNRLFKENSVLHEEIQEKERMLAREVVSANKQMHQMQISVLNQNFKQKIDLATFLMNQLTNLNALRGSIEISLAQVRTGISPVELEMQLDEMEVVLEDAEEANKAGRALGGKTITPEFPVETSATSNVAEEVKAETPAVQAEMVETPVTEVVSTPEKTEDVVPQV